jgi:RNA polymerase-binding protein DksA
MPAKKFKKVKSARVARKAPAKAKVKAGVKLKAKIKAQPAAKIKTAPKKLKVAGKVAVHKVIRVGKAASRPEPMRKPKGKSVAVAAPSRPASGKAVNGKPVNGKPINGHHANNSSNGVARMGASATKIPVTKLTKSELEEFRMLLLDKRREILGDVGSMESEAFRSQDNHSSSPMHMADVGTDNFEQEFTLGLIESERELLKEIQEALGRIEDGTFGICVATGKPIGKARLEAKPWAKYCIEYARMLENGMLPRNSGDIAAFEMADEDED